MPNRGAQVCHSASARTVLELKQGCENWMADIPGQAIFTSVKVPGFRHMDQAFGMGPWLQQKPEKQMGHCRNPTSLSKKGNSQSEANLAWWKMLFSMRPWALGLGGAWIDPFSGGSPSIRKNLKTGLCADTKNSNQTRLDRIKNAHI